MWCFSFKSLFLFCLSLPSVLFHTWDFSILILHSLSWHHCLVFQLNVLGVFSCSENNPLNECCELCDFSGCFWAWMMPASIHAKHCAPVIRGWKPPMKTSEHKGPNKTFYILGFQWSMEYRRKLEGNRIKHSWCKRYFCSIWLDWS